MNEMILVIDDEPAIRTILEYILLAAGYRVCTAMSGEAGIRKAWEDQPSLVILDINMPGTDGHDVARTLKAAPKTADIPIIFISGMVTQKEDGLLGPCGHPFIAKPFNKMKVLETILKYLRPLHAHAPV